MKTRIVLFLTVFAAAIPSFALPPPRVQNPSKRQNNGPVIKWKPDYSRFPA